MRQVMLTARERTADTPQLFVARTVTLPAPVPHSTWMDEPLAGPSIAEPAGTVHV